MAPEVAPGLAEGVAPGSCPNLALNSVAVSAGDLLSTVYLWSTTRLVEEVLLIGAKETRGGGDGGRGECRGGAGSEGGACRDRVGGRE